VRRRAATALAILAMAAAIGIVGAAAQSPTDPKPKITPPPRLSAKSHAGGRSDACNSFGAGFARVPGTDACIKIGVSVTTEATGTGN